MEAALARYYFNGTIPVDSLEYKIDETLPEGYERITQTEGQTSVTISHTTENDPNSYLVGTGGNVVAPFSDTNFRTLTAGNTAQSLNLTNYKKAPKRRTQTAKEI